MKEDDGVPRLVQELRYIAGGMFFDATFFDGSSRLFTSDDICPDVELMQLELTRMQMLQAENEINKFAELYWKDWKSEDKK